MEVDCLGLDGALDEGHIYYSFVDVAENRRRIHIGDTRGRPRTYGAALSKLGFEADAGRIFGVRHARDALKELIEHRRFRGGPVWTEELVFGRIRHLQRRYKSPFKEPFDLRVARKVLKPRSDSYVHPRGKDRGQSFTVADLLHDIDSLLDNGTFQLIRWWDEPRELDLHTVEGQSRLARTLDGYHRRRQQAYAEVVERNTPAVASLLPNFRMMPLRLEIEAELYERDGYETVSLDYRQWPVRSNAEAGATVTFPDIRTNLNSKESIDNYVRQAL